MGSLQEQLSMLTVFALPMAGGAALAYGLYQLWHDLRKPEQKRIQQRLHERTAAVAKSRQSPAANILRKQLGQENKLMDRLLAKLAPVEKIQKVFEQAGITWAATRFLVNAASVALLAILVLNSKLTTWVRVSMGVPGSQKAKCAVSGPKPMSCRSIPPAAAIDCSCKLQASVGLSVCQWGNFLNPRRIKTPADFRGS